MARKCLMVKSFQKKPKYSTQNHSRCPICGRPRGYMRQFDMCRICFREKASIGEIPGIKKASW